MVDVKRLRRFGFLSSMSDEELGAWTSRFSELQLPRNEFVFREGEPGNGIFLIEAGQIAAYKRLDEGGEQFLAYFMPGDFCGLDAIFDGDVHGMTLRTSTQTALLLLGPLDLQELFDTYPRVLSDLRSINAIQRKRYFSKFRGKRPDEAMLVFDHHHWIELVPWITGAVILLLAVLVGPAVLGVQAPLWVYGLALLGFAAAMFYIYVEWKDDWFIVTSKRIIHRDATFEIFNEVQEEAPLEMVQNVTTEIDSFLENLLNFGDVIIQTAGGKVSFQRVPHPAQTRDIILAEIQRTRDHRRVDELSEIRKALHHAIQPPADGVPPPAPAPHPLPPTFVRRVANMFGGVQIIPPARLMKDNQIIWRKHILLLYRDIALPLFLLLLLLPLSVLMVFNEFFGVRVPLLLTLLLATLGTPALIIWLFYRYRDWENDIYVLTPDQLIDSERKPFWLEEKVKVVGLGQVQNVRFERTNLLHNVFNYGRVVVQTAGQDSGLIFDNIPGPRAVEEEILEALERFKERQRERERIQRRREFQDWFGEYHKLKSEDANTPAPP